MFYENNNNDRINDFNGEDWVQFLKNDTEPRVIFTNSTILPEEMIEILGGDRCMLAARFVVNEFVPELSGRQGFRNSYFLCPPDFTFDDEVVKESLIIETLRLNLIFLHQKGEYMRVGNKFHSLVKFYEPDFPRRVYKRDVQDLAEGVWRGHPTYVLFADPLQLIIF